MKNKIVAITFSLVAFAITKVSAADPGVPVNDPCKKSIISGSISHATTKKPIRDVNVTAYLDTKKEKNASTDENGNYYFDELKPGKYKFIFHKNGYRSVTKEKTILSTDDQFLLNIELMENDVDLISPFHFSN